jgi:hypothetical protein
VFRTEEISELSLDRYEDIRRSSRETGQCLLGALQYRVDFRFGLSQWCQEGRLLSEDIATETVFDINREAAEQVHLLMRQHKIVSLLLKGKKLLDQIEVGR